MRDLPALRAALWCAIDGFGAGGSVVQAIAASGNDRLEWSAAAAIWLGALVVTSVSIYRGERHSR